MQSVKEMYKIGNGPSSSHTMGPAKAAAIFKEKNPMGANLRTDVLLKTLLSNITPSPRRLDE